MLSCPFCSKAHFPAEVCGRDSERGLAWNERLASARVPEIPPGKREGPWIKPLKPAPERPKRPDPPTAKSTKPVTEKRRAYMREYMRAYRSPK